jgi:hypothetical protein
MRLQNQVTLTTGSTTGIGAVMARRVVAEGARAILHGRNLTRGEAKRAEPGAAHAAFIAGSLADTLRPDRVHVSQMNVGWSITDNEHETRRSDGMRPDCPERLPLSASPSVQLPKPEGFAEAALCCARTASRSVSAAQQ